MLVSSAEYVFSSGRGNPAGGMNLPRSLRTTFSHSGACAAGAPMFRPSSERPDILTFWLWHPRQYLANTSCSDEPPSAQYAAKKNSKTTRFKLMAIIPQNAGRVERMIGYFTARDCAAGAIGPSDLAGKRPGVEPRHARLLVPRAASVIGTVHTICARSDQVAARTRACERLVHARDCSAGADGPSGFAGE